ncbi:ascorbate peroxidase 6 isoform X2 [Tasmannia lanceolata]|uniref:ascorbate peroxidase 6 isoform X2 n=1 Tax=Tasmannia lanceolata TaxID=3420 RepID=UPI004063F717
MRTMSLDPSFSSSLKNSFSPPPTNNPLFKSRGKKTVLAFSKECSYGNNIHNFHTRRGLIFKAISFPFLLPLHELGVHSSASPIIRDAVRKVLSKTKAAGVLRLVFHDAGTFDMDDNSGGMNGSIVYELDRPENSGLSKSVKILEKARTELENTQPAGSEAVSLCEGPIIPVQLGRLDSMVPDPQGKLPQESLDVSGLKKCFLRKGFSTQELVALSGAHTIGSKGFGNPTVFDNSYFKVLLEKPWTSSAGMLNMIGLPSDHALVDDDECLSWVKLYANDQKKFFEDFTRSYVKLVNAGALWRNV